MQLKRVQNMKQIFLRRSQLFWIIYLLTFCNKSVIILIKRIGLKVLNKRGTVQIKNNSLAFIFKI